MFLGVVIFESYTLCGYNELINLSADSSRPGIVGADFEKAVPSQETKVRF
jgi:hypothetical protein